MDNLLCGCIGFWTLSTGHSGDKVTGDICFLGMNKTQGCDFRGDQMISLLIGTVSDENVLKILLRKFDNSVRSKYIKVKYRKNTVYKSYSGEQTTYSDCLSLSSKIKIIKLVVTTCTN